MIEILKEMGIETEQDLRDFLDEFEELNILSVMFGLFLSSKGLYDEFKELYKQAKEGFSEEEFEELCLENTHLA